MRINLILAVIICALIPGGAWAGVADSSANGFTVKVTLNIQASPEEVYRKLVNNVGDWWDPSHTFSGNSHNLTIDERPMGCFCEKLPNAGGVRHMEVVRFAPAKTLVMIGGLGPLQSMATSGSMTIEFSPLNGGTKLEITYAVTGYRAEGMKELAAVVDGVTTTQFVRLKNYVEHGTPASDHAIPASEPRP